MARAQREAESARFWLSFIRLMLGGLVAVGSGAAAGAALWYFAASPTAMPDLGPTLLTASGGEPEQVTLVPAPQASATEPAAGDSVTLKLAPPSATVSLAAARDLQAPPILVPDETLQLSWMEEPPIEHHEPVPEEDPAASAALLPEADGAGAPDASAAQVMHKPTAGQIDAALAALDLDSLRPAYVASERPPAWQRNAVKAAKPFGGPVIALVIDDLGLNRPNTRRTIELPGPLTLALMTYAEGLQKFANRARARGHELMVHFPMAPLDPRYDPGPNALRADLGTEELARRLDWGLSRFEGYVGINNHMGSGFTTSIPGMAQVMLELKARGLLYVDSLTVPGAVGAQLADRLGVPFAKRDVFIDNDYENRQSIRRQLQRLEEIALRRGAAIGIGHPHDETIEELAVWLPEVQKRGFTLVPVSALVRTPSGVAVTPKATDGPG